LKMPNRGTLTLHCIAAYHFLNGIFLKHQRETGNPFPNIPMKQSRLTINNGVFIECQRETGNRKRVSVYPMKQSSLSGNNDLKSY